LKSRLPLRSELWAGLNLPYAHQSGNKDLLFSTSVMVGIMDSVFAGIRVGVARDIPTNPVTGYTSLTFRTIHDGSMFVAGDVGILGGKQTFSQLALGIRLF
jgi:hypothetical protein